MSLKETVSGDAGNGAIVTSLPIARQVEGNMRFSRVQRRNWRNRRKIRGYRKDQRGTT